MGFLAGPPQKCTYQFRSSSDIIGPRAIFNCVGPRILFDMIVFLLTREEMRSIRTGNNVIRVHAIIVNSFVSLSPSILLHRYDVTQLYVYAFFFAICVYSKFGSSLEIQSYKIRSSVQHVYENILL